MEHSFDIKIAQEYGIEEAIIFKHIAYWHEVNKANQRNFFDGRYWMYNSAEAFHQLFPYMSSQKIQRLLKALEEFGLILSGCYNENPFNRTKWYTLAEKGEMLYYGCTEGAVQEDDEHDSSEADSGLIKSDESFTSNNNIASLTDINNTNIKHKNPVFIDSLRSSINMSDSDESADSIDQNETVIKAWNDMAEENGLNPVKRVDPNSKRGRHLRRRIEENGTDAVLDVIRQVGNSSFLTGHNKEGWTATFDWMLLPSNFTKIAEGNYRNKDKPSHNSAAGVDMSVIDNW